MNCRVPTAVAFTVACLVRIAVLAQDESLEKSTVVLRSGLVVEVADAHTGPAGLLPAGDTKTIGWEQVRLVEGPLASLSSAYMEIAQDAWRARARLLRGDWELAAPLYESLFERYRNEWGDNGGATGWRIAEGTLACRLQTYDVAGAIEAWLCMLRLQDTVVSMESSVGVFDVETGLVPALSPIWTAKQARLICNSLERLQTAAGESPRANRVLVLCHDAANAVLGKAAASKVEFTVETADLFELVVAAIAEDEDKRLLAVRTMESRLEHKKEDAGTWKEAWCRAGIGAGMLRANDAKVRRLGAIELLHVPARFRMHVPMLAHAVSLLVANEVQAGGNDTGAALLRGDFDPVANPLWFLEHNRGGQSSFEKGRKR